MRVPLTIVISLYLATICQVALSPRMAVLEARPAFVVLVVMALALCLRGPAVIWSGFLGGLFLGIATGSDYGPVIFSLILGGWLTYLFQRLDIEIGVILGSIVIGIGTLVTFLLLMFVNPQLGIGGAVQLGIKSAVYNILLAVPIFAALRMILKTRSAGV